MVRQDGGPQKTLHLYRPGIREQYSFMTERLTMNGRPKNPKFVRNKNVIVIGGSGSGKTDFM